MPRRCQVCHALLSSYNPNKLCCPCTRKKLEIVEQKLLNPQAYRHEYVYGLLERTTRTPIGQISARNKVRV